MLAIENAAESKPESRQPLCAISADPPIVRGRKQRFTYRLLVSHASVKEWEPKPIKSLGEQRDLYTVFSCCRESDEFEHWIQREFEDAGMAATEKMVSGARLTPADWDATHRYVAAQDLRTPLTFIETMQRWGTDLGPAQLTGLLRGAIEEIQVQRAAGTIPTSSPGLVFMPNRSKSQLIVHRIRPLTCNRPAIRESREEALDPN